MHIKPQTGVTSSRSIFKIKLVLLLFFLFIVDGHTALISHPRVLLNRDDVDRIAETILTHETAKEDFRLFLTNTSYTISAIPFRSDTPTLHHMLNVVMKNSFLYLMGQQDARLTFEPGYAISPDSYMQRVEEQVRLLCHPDTIKKIQAIGGLEAPGYAVKTLAIAYDWAHDYFQNTPNSLNEIEAALRLWAVWYTAPDRYYGSVFENHAPWGAKSLAYMAAALGDNNLFYDTDTKIQASFLPADGTVSIQGQVHISAKGFFDQVLHAANFVANPNGGWHESVSYFLTKEIPELLEYAEVICTYHNDPIYTESVYTSPLFKNSGLFLFHMTTPDGMLQKIGDTGSKTALPSEFYQNGGFAYGDINNIGAGYLAGYFLQRLERRLTSFGADEHAQFLQYYIDNYCFAFETPVNQIESGINLLYSLLWKDYADSTSTLKNQLETNRLYSNSIYFDNSGVLISKNPDSSTSSTVVRFDAQPYFFGNHQHFASGNFTIFKGANLVIDGGRYISPQTKLAEHYAETFYRGPVCHNVLLIGDELSGQKTFRKQSNHAPYTFDQLEPYQAYATKPENVSIFLSEQHQEWTCPWQISGMILNLTSLYDVVGAQHYSRTLLHLFRQDTDDLNDLILTVDDIELDAAAAAHWQMHVRDNGKNDFYGDSVYVVQRDEAIPPHLVASEFGSRYRGELLVKALTPGLTASLAPVPPPDTLCRTCWNGRIWEESTHMVRFRSAPNTQHQLVMALLPGIDKNMPEGVAELSHGLEEINGGDPYFQAIKIHPVKNGQEALYLVMARAHLTSRNSFELHLQPLSQGWIIFFGITSGDWEMRLADQKGVVLETKRAAVLENYPDALRGVLFFHLDKKLESQKEMLLTLNKL